MGVFENPLGSMLVQTGFVKHCGERIALTTADPRKRRHRAEGATARDNGHFLLDLRGMGRAPGTVRQLLLNWPAPQRIGLDLVAVPEGAPIAADVTVQAVSEGVLVMGTVTAPVSGECSRCLEPFTDELELELTELFAYPDSLTEATTDEDEVYRMVDDTVDLLPVLIDLIGLELPLRPLCAPDCAGLCPDCGVRMAVAGPQHRHDILDPRWAGLAKLAAEREEP